MALSNKAHVSIGGTNFLLDEDYEQQTGRRHYVHGGRSIFANRTDITGRPGAQNLQENYLVWDLTRYDGEGQVVLDPSDNDSQFRFYRSEGLNFRVPGQFGLNKSILSETVSTTSSTTTWEGAANFSDITGASTTSGTDRLLTAVGDKIAAASSVTPGAANMQFDYYLYTQAPPAVATTIQGSAFTRVKGSPTVSGTDLKLDSQDGARSAKLTVGVELTAAVVTRVDFYQSVSSYTGNFSIYVIDVTTATESVVTRADFKLTTASLAYSTLIFTPTSGHIYQFQVYCPGTTAPVTFDKAVYVVDASANNTATIEVYNQTTSATVTTKTVQVTATAAGTVMGSISLQTVGATDYRARVSRAAGLQKIVVDKVIARTLTAASWTIDALDLGLGTNASGVFTPKIYATAHASAVDSRIYSYNISTDVWDSFSILDSSTGSNLTARAMAHSNGAEYVLLDSEEIISVDSAGTDTLYASYTAGTHETVGLAVCQNRVWVMDETASATTGVSIISIPLDSTAGLPYDLYTAGTNVRILTIPAGIRSPDLSLRQRMCSAPTGVRFFLNYGDVTSKVYEVDGSGTTLEPRELADLGAGVRATCIAYQGGITFIGAQYYGDATASGDSDKKPRSCLFAIDQNGVLQLVEFFRQDAPDVNPPQFIVPYQTDLFILQGSYVWRHDLRNGGLYLEYQLDPQTSGNQRALAVLFGRIFAGFTTEIFVAGSVGTYRQASVLEGSTYTSSIYDFGLPSAKKALAKIDVSTNTMAANTSVNLEYQLDQSGTWVAGGQMTQGIRQTFYFTDTSFTTLQVRVKCNTSDGVSTPTVKGVTVWASAAEDEEYFDLVLLTENQDSYFRIDGEQIDGPKKADAIVTLWRSKAVTTFTDGYGIQDGAGISYLVTIEDLRVENNNDGEGRTVVTLRVVR